MTKITVTTLQIAKRLKYYKKYETHLAAAAVTSWREEKKEGPGWPGGTACMGHPSEKEGLEVKKKGGGKGKWRLLIGCRVCVREMEDTDWLEFPGTRGIPYT